MRDAAGVEVRPYGKRDLVAVLDLCVAEGWDSLPADAVRAHRILTNPGVTTVVAADDDGTVVGFLYLLSDGEVQAYIASMAVASSYRGRGIGTRLVSEAVAASGAERADLLSDADGFYESLPYVRRTGFRIYPGAEPGNLESR